MTCTPEQLALFRSLFRGRDDVFARYWHSTKGEKSGYTPAKFHTGEYAPLTDDIVLSHIRGDAFIGIYPLFKDNSTWFLAVDFDGDRWLTEAGRLIETVTKHDILFALERSKSGNGGHVWFFFEKPVPAWKARLWGKYLLTEAGITRLSTFDRMFPSQDEHTGKHLGNLIALPLSGTHVTQGNSCFIQRDGTVWSDQWEYLAFVARISEGRIDLLITGIPRTEGDEGDPTTEKVFDRVPTVTKQQATLVLESEIFIPSSGLPDILLKFLRKKLVFPNPEHLLNERRGYSNWATPCWIYALRRYEDGIVVPAGLLEEIRCWTEENGISLSIEDRRSSPKKFRLSCDIKLRPEQETALKKVLQHERCILEAPPGSGKTMVGIAYICKRGMPTLVIVHTKELLQQWKKRIEDYCTLKKGDLGIIGDSKWKIGKLITLASQKTLIRRDLTDIKNVFGCCIVDECHHVPASTFLSVVREFSCLYFLGLTATPYRKDKLERLMVAAIGPIVKAKAVHTDDHSSIQGSIVPVTAHMRSTTVKIQHQGLDFLQVSEALMRSDERNVQIAADITKLLAAGRKCLVLSERVEHCHTLYALIRAQIKGVHGAVGEGTMTKKERMRLSQRIRQERFQFLIATGKLIGEGFDWPEAEHLFFVLPFSWKGKIVQYVGRVQRAAPGKTQAYVYDYVDFAIPMMKHMYFQRLRTYRSMGFDIRQERLAVVKNSVSEQQISMF